MSLLTPVFVLLCKNGQFQMEIGKQTGYSRVVFKLLLSHLKKQEKSNTKKGLEGQENF